MTLGELIQALEQSNQDRIVPMGFYEPHSYRGYYDELAFKPKSNTTVAKMLECAYSAVNKTFTGYKGGEYKMTLDTSVYIANYGECGEEIGPILLGYMLGGEHGGRCGE